MKRLSSMSEEELNALTREDLIARILELEPPPPNDWHSWMDALLHIVLHPYPVEIEREIVLVNQPPRSDYLVLMEKEIVDLRLSIFKIFREHNIIEFKDPDDELNMSVFWKCIGYVGFYLSAKGISANQVTLTLIRASKPVRLLKQLSADIEPGGEKGIYYVKNWLKDVPIQIIVTSELTGPEYAGFRSISKRPKLEDITQMYRDNENETDPALIEFYRAYWSISARLTGSILEEAKRSENKMSKTLMDILKPEIDEKIDIAVKEAVKEAVSATVRNNLYAYVQDGDMALDRAAIKAGLSTDDFILQMSEAGYTVPDSCTHAG